MPTQQENRFLKKLSEGDQEIFQKLVDEKDGLKAVRQGLKDTPLTEADRSDQKYGITQKFEEVNDTIKRSMRTGGVFGGAPGDNIGWTGFSTIEAFNQAHKEYNQREITLEQVMKKMNEIAFTGKKLSKNEEAVLRKFEL